MDIAAESLKIEPEIIRWRRDLHQCPELALELPQTTAYVKKELEAMGLEVKEYMGGNGLSVLIEGEKEGPASDRVLAIRTDTDGLPIREETGLPFASTNGCMHACGHDGHTAVVLGVTQFLASHRQLFRGKVLCFFQPGEEYPGGAKPMLEEGLFSDAKVTRSLGMHMGHLDPAIPDGTLSYRSPEMMASMDRFFFRVKGKGYHGAYPERSFDPIMAMTQLVAALQTIKSRNIKAADDVVISVTHIEGGINQNIIPNEVIVEGTVRTFDNAMRKFIHHKMVQIAEGVGVSFGVTIETTYDYKYPPLLNDPTVTEETVKAITEALGESVIVPSKEAVMSGEDFAYYAEAVPSCFLFLANPGYIEGSFHGHHSSKFDLDESYFKLAWSAFIASTLDYLK